MGNLEKCTPRLGHATAASSPCGWRGNGGFGPLVSPQSMHDTDIDAAFQCDFRDGDTFGQEQAYSFLRAKARALPAWFRRGVWRFGGEHGRKVIVELRCRITSGSLRSSALCNGFEELEPLVGLSLSHEDLIKMAIGVDV